MDALAWGGAQGQGLALDSSRLAVGGDCAGGTLAAALSIAARARGDLPQPGLQILAYPGLSSHQDSESYARYGRGHLLAECDPLVDEGHLYADRLREAGVPVRVGLYKGMVHEFLRMTALVDEATKAREDIAKALCHALGRE